MRSCGFPWPIGGVRWWWFAGLAVQRGTSFFNFFGRPCAENVPRGQNHQYGNYKLYKPTPFPPPFFYYLSMGIWTSTPTYEQIRARNNRAAVVSVPLPALPFPGAGRAKNRQTWRSMRTKKVFFVVVFAAESSPTYRELKFSSWAHVK